MAKLVNVSLLQYFRTGQLGPVALGMTRRKVRSLLGEPDQMATDVAGFTSIWKYGDLEMIFSGKGRTISLIDLHAFHGIPQGGRRIRMDPWIVREGCSRRMFQRELGRESVPFGLTDWRQQPWGDDGTTRVWCGIGIELVFLDRTSKNYGPAGFHGAFLSPPNLSKG